jgi:hypothetical protein
VQNGKEMRCSGGEISAVQCSTVQHCNPPQQAIYLYNRTSRAVARVQSQYTACRIAQHSKQKSKKVKNRLPHGKLGYSVFFPNFIYSGRRNPFVSLYNMDKIHATTQQEIDLHVHGVYMWVSRSVKQVSIDR